MSNEFILPDTDQIRRMKEVCLSSSAYSCGGELYKLLSRDILHELVKKIPNKSIKLPSDLLYGKKVITSEEKFLENLDKYIGYIKDRYLIQHIELLILIEMSLSNKYNSILFDMSDYHHNQNYIKYHDAFRKMFLFNFYDNIRFYSKYVDKYDSINLFLDETKDLDFDDPKDIILLENIFIKVFNNRFDNLFNSFVPNNEVDEDKYYFYIHQVNWVLSDYYEKGTYSFELTDNDHYIDLYNGDKLIFNVIKDKRIKDEIKVRFGVINKNFCADKIITFKKQEFKNILDRIKNIDTHKTFDVNYDFIDSTLVMNFWNYEGIQFLDIYFEYSNNGDKFVISMDPEDTKNLYKLIKEQV